MLPVDLLEGFERKMAKFQNRPACNVDITTLPEEYDDIKLLYDRNRKHIVFNDKFYHNRPEIEVMGALFHGIRHAYQHYVIETNDMSQEPVDLIEQWKTDFDEYIQSINKDELESANQEKDFMVKERVNNQNILLYNISKIHEKTFDYCTSSIEVDALAYADLNIYHIYKLHLDIPKGMKDLVLKRQQQIKDRDDIIKM